MMSNARAADYNVTTDTTTGINLDAQAGSTAEVSPGVTVTNAFGSKAVTATTSAWGLTNRGSISSLYANTISLSFAGSSVTNFGAITAGSVSNAISLAGGGSVDNQAGATIDSKLSAIIIGAATAGAGSVTNAGSITQSGTAGDLVTLRFGGIVTNLAGGVISAHTSGNAVSIGQGASRTVINSGTISNTGTGYATGVLLQGGASTITNNATGRISGTYNGVYASGTAPLTFSNAGLIESTGTTSAARAVEATGGGAFINSGTIQSAASDGLYLARAGAVTNSGTISGAVRAINFSGNFTYTLNLDTGSVLNGVVQGGAGANNLVLMGTGAESAARFLAFNTLSMQGTAWLLNDAGAFTTSAEIQSGKLTVAGALTSPTITVRSGGALQLGNGGATGSIFGNVINDGVLAFNRSDNVTFARDISGSGAVQQIGTGGTILNGANTYSGGTTVNGGALRAGSAGAFVANTAYVVNSGALDLGGYHLTMSSLSGTGGTIAQGGASLTIDQTPNTTYAGSITGTGSLTKQGAGTFTLTGAGSSVGAVTVSGGALEFGLTGAFNAASHTTGSGASTTIDGSAQLAVTGAFAQASGSTLNVTVGSNAPIITADMASLDGTLNVAGYTASAASSASALSGTQFTVIHTRNGITGDFANVTVGGSSSPVDYLKATGGKSADNLDYNVDLGLTWNAGTARGDGAFTLTNSADAFNVDVALSNQTGPFASGWDGKSLTKNGGGALTLSAMNTYTGATAINDGTLAIAATGGITSDVANYATFLNAGTVAGSVTNNGGSTFTQTGGSVRGGVTNNGTVNANGGALNGAITNNTGGAFNIGGIVTGNGAFANARGATLTVTNGGGYTLAGLLTNNGSVTVDAGSALIANGGILNNAGGVITNNGALTDALNNAGLVINNATYNANVASNTGAIVNNAGATWNGNFNTAGIINNAGAINGSLTQSAGTATNNGAITGAVTVSGGLFTGIGSAGDLTIGSGATVAPGNNGGIGTMSVAANVTFNAGSIYQVAVNAAGQGSRISAAGAISINGGAVDVLAGSGNYAPSTTYTILSTTTNGGRMGTFNSVTSNLAFLDPSLSYDSNNVYLAMTRNTVAFNNVGITPNQIATGGGVESLGIGNTIYNAVLNLSAPQARYAFDQVSGEIHASAKTALIEDTRFVRNAVNDRIRAAFDGVGASGTVTTYVDGKPVTVKANTNRFAVWGQGLGSWGHTSSNNNAARLNRSTGGFFIGADIPVFDTWRFGAVAGYSRTNFGVKDRHSSGWSDNYHVGLYGGTAWGDLSFRAGAAYAWHNISISRSVVFPGFSDSLKGGYNAATAQLFGELAYGFNAGGARFEPFANLAYVNLHTDGFTERGGGAALTNPSSNTDATFTTLGLRGSTTFDLGGTMLTAKGMVGWRHAFGDVTPLATMRFAGGGNAFSIGGVPIARDAAVIEAGLDYAFTPNAALGVSYGGQFGSRMSDQSVKANFNWKF